MKINTTKRSLLTSVIALTLCFAMLLGTTFAWFTDSVTSTGNKIQSGTLKIDLEVLDQKTNLWASVKEDKDPIFTYDNWEPGYTEVKVLKVENEGTLHLKWKAQLTSANPLSELAKVIDVYVCPSPTEISYPAGRDLTGYTLVGTLDNFINTIEETTYGTLAPKGEAGDVAYLGIAFKMQESAGNDYQELALGEFDIIIAATQLDAEEDSFGSDYDADLDASKSGTTKVTADGSKVMYYSDESGWGDRVRLSEIPENLGNEYVVPAEVNDLGGALVGVTLDKLTVHEDVEYASKSLEGANIGAVVVEEGMTSIPNRMFYGVTADSIALPSTLEIIVDNVFQKAVIDEIKIPATVTTIGETAFGASKVKKVIIEGNTSIQGYAFRGCTNLREVYLNGDDVTFIPSTLNGRNSTWFCNGESNNPGTSNITFYVKNETVAARVKAAMGAECSDTDQQKPICKVAIYVEGNSEPYYKGGSAA